MRFTGLPSAKRRELRQLLKSNQTPGSQAVRRGSGYQAVASLCLPLLLATSLCAASLAIHRAAEIQRELPRTASATETRIAQLGAGIHFASRRQLLLVGIRDEILRTNLNLSFHEATDYADLALSASEKYPSVDPLMFLAVGIVESGYDRSATSRADAKGLYQIWPVTGRLLARTLNWEYSDEMLYDPEKNTEMAALYFDILHSKHEDVKVVLAEYNGGPENAHYFQEGSALIADETRDYAPRVLGVYERLKNRYTAEGETCCGTNR